MTPTNSDEWVGFLVGKIEQIVDGGYVPPTSMWLNGVADAIEASATTSKVLIELKDKIRGYQK